MTVNDIERGLVARYLARLLARPDLAMRPARFMLYWLNERADALNLPIPAPLAEVMGGYYQQGFKAADFERVFLAHRTELVASLDAAARETERPEPLATNVRMIIDALGLPEAEATWMLVGLVASASRFEQVQYLANQLLDFAPPHARTIALMLGLPTRSVEELISPGSDLVGSGLIQLREGETVAGYNARFAIPTRVNANLDRAFADFSEMRDALLGAPLASPVQYDDYQHVAADRDLIKAVLDGAAKEGAAGVNILLYGPPGAGKTELAKVVAQAAGLALFAAGEDASRDGEADRLGRIADLVFAGRLLAGQRRTALLFDEMEDVAVHLIRRGGSKVYLNRLLETNPVPTIWTSNALADIDPALLRRMTLAIELKRPPASQRQRIISRLLDRAGMSVDAADLRRLADQLDATPAIIENAIRAARLAGGGVGTIEHAAKGIMRAVTGFTGRQMIAIPAFDPELTTASQDLIVLADQLVGGKARAFSLCLSGPPGTGKSAFARYLAGRLGLEVLLKRASDLLGPYVGQTERAIADAFDEAREAGAVLVFDEADSLLMDRREAVRSWEISQVNEMLTWMEDHPLPVCFTTNLMDRMDTASLRRFTFHVRFSAMDRRALARAWKVFFGRDVAPADGLIYHNLTPGDFAKARKQAEMLGILADDEQLTALIAEIARAKPEASGGGLGFVR
ncbi:MAG: AAA family ATPase [Hyphomicrobiaceae bacterium]